MPWLETNVQDQRIQFVIAMQQTGAKLARVCRVFQISRTTGYKWLARDAAAHSVTAVGGPIATASSEPASDGRGDDEADREFAGGIRMGRREARDVVGRRRHRDLAQDRGSDHEREGLTRLDTAPAPALTRFERPAANDLWQMDAKGHYPLRPQGRCHPLSILDDHSRYAVGLAALPALETGGVQRTLTACFERYGLPTAMLMDHGVPWWSATNEGGLTTLSVFLLKQGIRLLYGRVRHPQTQGKVEASIAPSVNGCGGGGCPPIWPGLPKPLRRSAAEYNDLRPHEALAMQPPASRFASSGRAYASAAHVGLSAGERRATGK